MRNNVKLNIKNEKYRKIVNEHVHQSKLESNLKIPVKSKLVSPIKTLNQELKNIGRDYIEELKNESKEYEYDWLLEECGETVATLPTPGETDAESKQND